MEGARTLITAYQAALASTDEAVIIVILIMLPRQRREEGEKELETNKHQLPVCVLNIVQIDFPHPRV
jgi:hypothetical protein